MFAAQRGARLRLARGPDAVRLLRQQIQQVHIDLERCAAQLNMTQSSTKWSPRVQLYVHALCVEDITIQSVLREVAPLFTLLWPSLGSPPDIVALRQYTRAVYASTDVYLVNLPSRGLSKVVDLNRLGLGRHSVAWVIQRFVVAELATACRAISGAATPASRTPSIHPTLHDARRRTSGVARNLHLRA